VEEVVNVAGLYHNPPDKAVVLGHKSVQALEADIRDGIDHWNQNPRPFA
jgi:hypothetical protein